MKPTANASEFSASLLHLPHFNSPRAQLDRENPLTRHVHPALKLDAAAGGPDTAVLSTPPHGAADGGQPGLFSAFPGARNNAQPRCVTTYIRARRPIADDRPSLRNSHVSVQLSPVATARNALPLYAPGPSPRLQPPHCVGLWLPTRGNAPVWPPAVPGRRLGHVVAGREHGVSYDSAGTVVHAVLHRSAATIDTVRACRDVGGPPRARGTTSSRSPRVQAVEVAYYVRKKKRRNSGYAYRDDDYEDDADGTHDRFFGMKRTHSQNPPARRHSLHRAASWGHTGVYGPGS